MKAALRTVAAAGVLLLTSCGLLDPVPWADRQAELDRNREVWEAAGFSSYRYALNRSCYCSLAGDLTVTVIGGAVVSAERPGGEPLPDTEFEFVETVDDLFDTVQRAIDQEVYRYDVRYHGELGYPTLIDLDPDRNAIDEELRLEAGEVAGLRGT